METLIKTNKSFLNLYNSELVDEMKLSFAEKELKKLGNAAHKAKSMASYLGTIQIREHIVNIENILDSNKDTESIDIELECVDTLLKQVIEELKEIRL